MSEALSTTNGSTVASTSSFTLELSLPSGAGDGAIEDRNVDEIYPTYPRPGGEPLSDKVIGLREWGTRQVFPLRAPPDSRGTPPGPMALQLSRSDLAIAPDRVELVYEGQSWRIKDWGGIAHLKQDGRPTREASLLPGAEITGGRPDLDRRERPQHRLAQLLLAVAGMERRSYRGRGSRAPCNPSCTRRIHRAGATRQRRLGPHCEHHPSPHAGR